MLFCKPVIVSRPAQDNGRDWNTQDFGTGRPAPVSQSFDWNKRGGVAMPVPFIRNFQLPGAGKPGSKE